MRTTANPVTGLARDQAQSVRGGSRDWFFLRARAKWIILAMFVQQKIKSLSAPKRGCFT